MMTIAITLLIISIICNVFIYDIPFRVKRYTHKNKYVNILLQVIYKVFTCVNCLSYHTTWLYYLIFFGSGVGFLYGFITYLLASFVDRWLHTTSL